MTCEKCASADVYTRYHGTHRECGYAARAKRYDMGEHLHRVCRGCGFDWADRLAVPSVDATADLSIDTDDNPAPWTHARKRK